MYLARKIDDNGLFVEDVILDCQPILMTTVTEMIMSPETGVEEPITREVPALDEFEQTIPDPHYIETPCPAGFYHPKWDGTQWVEGGTPPASVPPTPTTEERLTATESAIIMLMGGIPNV